VHHSPHYRDAFWWGVASGRIYGGAARLGAGISDAPCRRDHFVAGSGLLGRYGSTVNLVIRGTQPLGAVTGAVIGEAFGARAAMWIAAGAITLSAGHIVHRPASP